MLTLLTIPIVLGPLPARRADGYRFFGRGGTDTSAYVASDAARWRSSVWGPGDTLVWRAADIPDWAEWYGSNKEFLDHVTTALAAWSSIATADLAWQVSGDLGERGEAFITMEETQSDWIAGQARLTFERGQITRCQVTIDPPTYERIDRPDGSYTILGVLPEERGVDLERILAHEFGHCLGLAHSFALPGSLNGQISFRDGGRVYGSYQDLALHPTHPRMSYGARDPSRLLAHDDVVGASLLRPAQEWEQGIGEIAGTVFVDGEPQHYARIWAFGSGEGATPGSPNAVTVLTDEDGTFHIEGLRPGGYALWVGSVTYGRCVPHLLPELARDLAETWLLVPILVRAGGTTRGVELHATRGRDCQPSSPWCVSSRN